VQKGIKLMNAGAIGSRQQGLKMIKLPGRGGLDSYRNRYPILYYYQCYVILPHKYHPLFCNKSNLSLSLVFSLL